MFVCGSVVNVNNAERESAMVTHPNTQTLQEENTFFGFNKNKC